MTVRAKEGGADYEMWHAAHDDCPPDGCGGCVVEQMDWDQARLAQIELAAALRGESVDVFIHKAIVAGLRG